MVELKETKIRDKSQKYMSEYEKHLIKYNCRFDCVGMKKMLFQNTIETFFGPNI